VFAGSRLVDRSESDQVVRFGIPPPDGAKFGMSRSAVSMDSSVKVSPDGRRIAFVAETADGRQFIWIRAVEGLAAEPLSGTENGVAPFWSPDGHYLAFFADGKLKKMEVSGGPPQVLCDTTGGLGGTWNSEGTIVFAAGSAPVLYRVPDRGGSPTAITTLDATRQEIGHLWPSFLPDGHHFLYRAVGATLEQSGTYIGSLDSDERVRVLDGASSAAVYAAPGYLVFVREGALVAQRFEADSMRPPAGPLVTLAANVAAPDANGRAFSAAETGAITFVTGGTHDQLAWFDREAHIAGDRASAVFE